METPKSFKPEVIADSSGVWAGNALRFPTYEEAMNNAIDLSSRWMLVREVRVSESEDEPNYNWVDGRLVEIKKVEAS